MLCIDRVNGRESERRTCVRIIDDNEKDCFQYAYDIFLQVITTTRSRRRRRTKNFFAKITIKRLEKVKKLLNGENSFRVIFQTNKEIQPLSNCLMS